MNDATDSQLQAFFKEFTKFTKQADAHWPLSNERKKKHKDTQIHYDFVSIVTKEDYDNRSNKALIDSFFLLYNDPDSIFSTGSQYPEESEIRSEICKLVRLESALLDKRKQCTLLLFGYDKSDPQKTLVGLVGYYFPESHSMLIQTIVMAGNLLGAKRQIKTGVSEKLTERGKRILMKYDASQQKVLGWLLTYRNKQERGGKAGLYHLVDRIERAGLVGMAGNNKKVPSDNVLGVFHEALNPALVFEGKDNLTPEEEAKILSRQRAATKSLLAFHKAEARFLRFAYRCPSKAGYGNNENRKYFLLTFPQTPRTPNYLTVSTRIVMAFIVDYHRSVHPAYVAFKEDIRRCWDFEPGVESEVTGFIDDFGKNPIVANAHSLFKNRFTPYATDIYLHNVPMQEQPRFSFRRASIGFEIIVDEDYFEPKGLDPYHYTIPPFGKSSGLMRAWRMVKNWLVKEDVIESKPLYCPVAHSGETDLFAYKYQSEPPYFTRYYGLRTSRITVEFPSYFEFTSEGRAETFYVLPESLQSPTRFEEVSEDSPFPYFMYSIKMNACVSYTYFLNSAVRVWHLVLKPDEELATGINELEIIKLMKFFSGSQEHENEEHRQNLVRKIKFSVDGQPVAVDYGESEPDNLIKLLYDLTKITYVTSGKRAKFRPMEKGDEVVSLRNLKSGVLEIDTGDVNPQRNRASREDSKSNFLGFYGNPDAPDLSVEERNKIRTRVQELYKNLYDDDIQMGDESIAFSVDEYANYVFKSFCGICLGIFDYGRMGLQEVDDTLVPLPDSKTEKSFMVIHRGVLAMLGHGDDVMDTFWNTLGINAYLLIPSAVLAHNDFVSRDAERRLNKMLADLRFDKTDPSISKLLSERNFIDDLLNDDLLGNVFQYKTEQELYEEGMARRGIAERIRDGRSKLEQLDKLIITKQEERRNRAQKFIQVILSLLSLVSLYTPLRDLYVDEVGYTYEVKELASTATVVDPKLANVTEKEGMYSGNAFFTKRSDPFNPINRRLKHHKDGLIIFFEKTGSFTEWLLIGDGRYPAREMPVEIRIESEKQKYQVEWPQLFSNLPMAVKQWLFPKNALDAAHHQIFVVLVIVLAYSIVTLLTAPGAMLQRFWRRRYNNRRRLPGNRSK